MRSEKQAQFTAAATVGAAAFGGYGVAKGAVSDNTTMFGGAVGGATFGGAVGAGLAYAASGAHGKGLRNVLRSLNNMLLKICFDEQKPLACPHPTGRLLYWRKRTISSEI